MGMGKKKRVRLKRKTYELIHPMTICRVCAALVIADNIPTNFLGVVVVGVRTRNDDTPVCALGRQTWASLWRALTITFARAVHGVRCGGRNKAVPIERHRCIGHHISYVEPDARARAGG